MRVRKGIIIRALIYGPIIGYLSWAGFCREPEVVTQEAPAARKVQGPDTSRFEVIELTPEQAEEMMGRPLPTPEEAAKLDAEPDQKADQAEPKAPSKAP